jgi:coproporphyrinogen III oxidase
MPRILAQSANATTANNLIQSLQLAFVGQLERVNRSLGCEQKFIPVEWFRDQGHHGGGIRYGIADSANFNRASINSSQVHYDDDSTKSLGSATALSTIIHPQNPHAPSMHMHISWTELKNGNGYWRIMADLNPAIPDNKDLHNFRQCLKQTAPEQFELASAQGDRYFYIPALNCHRGVQHFYLEQYHSGDEQADLALARSVGEAVIQSYCDILFKAISKHPNPDNNDYDKQLAYHTLYLFQVLTLDRGTTSGILVHDQNDVGILASLPAQIDHSLLSSWQTLMPKPQNLLLEAILNTLPEQSPCLITNEIKQSLAQCIRKHYQQYPEALDMQATSDITPPTVANHS